MFVSMSELQTQSWQRKGRKGWGGGGEGGRGEGGNWTVRMTQLLFPQTSTERWLDCLLRDESVLTQLLESQGLGRDGAARHVGWLWRTSDARVPPLSRARITKSCQTRRAWIQHDSAADSENPRYRRNSFHSILKTIWLLSANTGKSRHLFDCWIIISEPWGVISKCGIVAGSCFHLWDSSAILLT